MKFVLLTLILSVSTLPLAHANELSGLYIGAGLGTSNFEDDNIFKDVTEPLNSDYDGNTYKVILGYQFNPFVALEAQYTTYDDTQYKFGNPVHSQVDFEHSAISITTNLGYSFDSGLRPFLLLGLSDVNTKVKATGNSNTANYVSSNGDADIAFRVGAGIKYAPHFLNGTSLRVAYEQDSYKVRYANTTTSYNQSVGSYYAAIIQRF